MILGNTICPNCGKKMQYNFSLHKNQKEGTYNYKGYIWCVKCGKGAEREVSGLSKEELDSLLLEDFEWKLEDRDE